MTTRSPRTLEIQALSFWVTQKLAELNFCCVQAQAMRLSMLTSSACGTQYQDYLPVDHNGRIGDSCIIGSEFGTGLSRDVTKPVDQL